MGGQIKFWILTTLAVALALSAGCTRSDEDEILVFAAASLADALTEIERKFESVNGNSVTFSYAASQPLAQQISAGAHADVFISAGRQPVEFLLERGLVEILNDSIVRNRLVVAVKNDPELLLSMSDLTKQHIERIAIADPILAPAATYSRESLQRLGLWDAVLPKLVFGSNVRTTLAYLESGNVDAAIVYASDARISTKVSVRDIVPPYSYSQVEYPAALVKNSKHRTKGIAFVSFLSTETARGILEKYGFESAK